uniref:Uncharacterized protein n=1 Tax=Arundo donax TaxID=35708 RepID=A0A0A9D8Y7_ARUDO
MYTDEYQTNKRDCLFTGKKKGATRTPLKTASMYIPRSLQLCKKGRRPTLSCTCRVRCGSHS